MTQQSTTYQIKHPESSFKLTISSIPGEQNKKHCIVQAAATDTKIRSVLEDAFKKIKETSQPITISPLNATVVRENIIIAFHIGGDEKVQQIFLKALGIQESSPPVNGKKH